MAVLARLHRLGIALFCVTCVLVPAAWADGASLIQGMGNAFRTLNYEGRFVFVSGEKMHTLEILHGVIDGDEYERLRTLDGQGAQIIRMGNNIICQLPAGEARLNRAQPLTVFKPPFADREIAGNPHYAIAQAGDDRVAGRIALQITVAPRDGYRLGYRLWVDQDSGLLLRSHTVDVQAENAAPLETFEFVSLEIMDRVDRTWFEPDPALPSEELHPQAIQEQSMAVPMFSAHWLPPGFERIEIKHWDAEGGRAETQIFSDGIAAFTAFIEPVNGPVETMQPTRRGATVAMDRALRRGEQGWLLTVVGEVPLGTAEKVVNGFAFRDDL